MHGDWNTIAISINGLTSLLVLAGVLVTQHDLRKIPGRLSGGGRKAVYRLSLFFFLTLVGFGEGLTVFKWVFGKVADTPQGEFFTGIALAMLSSWFMVVRPLNKMEVLCPFKRACPVTEAEREDGSATDILLQLGEQRARGLRAGRACAGSP